MGTLTETADTLQTRADVIDSAVEASVGTNQSRDAKVAQVKEAAQEARGTGTDNTDSNKAVLLKQIDVRIAAFVKAGNTKGADAERAKRKRVEEM